MTIVHGYVKLPEGKPTNIYLGSPKLLLSPGKQWWNWRKTTSMGHYGIRADANMVALAARHGTKSESFANVADKNK